MTEMTQLSERPGFTDIAATMPPDAIGGLRQLAQITMDKGFAPKDFLMESGAAINPAEPTTMMFNPRMLKDYVIKQAKGTVYSLALTPLINWLNDQNTGMGNMVVAGLAAFDIMNSADPLGAIMFGLATPTRSCSTMTRPRTSSEPGSGTCGRATPGTLPCTTASLRAPASSPATGSVRWITGTSCCGALTARATGFP